MFRKPPDDSSVTDAEWAVIEPLLPRLPAWLVRDSPPPTSPVEVDAARRLAEDRKD